MTSHARYRSVRQQTLALAASLTAEDQLVQSMPDASPVKWHLAHTTWFFETLVLARQRGHRPFREEYGYLWNSYYEALGSRQPRHERGLLSRPSLEEVHAYRAFVDEAMSTLLETEPAPELAHLIELGVHHEQQHQELILTDIKHAFGTHPLQPAYTAGRFKQQAADALRWHAFDGGLTTIGHEGASFSFDNERPRHRVFLEPFSLADRLVTAGEYIDFIRDGGYERPTLWLADGWGAVEREGWTAPLYWTKRNDELHLSTLIGTRPVSAGEPVCHVSYYEADAYARWAGARLPTELEWEAVASGAPRDGNFLESRHFHPVAAPAAPGVRQLFGDTWQWTQSAYLPYPGFKPEAGNAGEYNGKFMSGQMVLRGGSCVTPQSHIRSTYRNFFPPSARWQFSGIRLARSSP